MENKVKFNEVKFSPELLPILIVLMEDGRFNIVINYYKKDRKQTYFTAWFIETHPCYIEYNGMTGISFSTVHIPNKYSGTGYRLESCSWVNSADTFLKNVFNACKTVVPEWDRRAAYPIRYKNMAQYLSLHKDAVEVELT